MTGRELLDDLAAALEVARNLRYRPAETFDDVPVEDLSRAARNLRAIGYSCTEGAKVLDRAINARVQPEGPLEP